MRLLAALFVGVVIGVLLHPWTGDAHWQPGYHNRVHAITWGFCNGSYKPCWLGNQALRVARCEAGPALSTRAHNGQYLGLFQVSAHWRRVVRGWGHDPWSQSLHAYRIYRITGGWSHWSCAHILGIA